MPHRIRHRRASSAGMIGPLGPLGPLGLAALVALATTAVSCRGGGLAGRAADGAPDPGASARQAATVEAHPDVVLRGDEPGPGELEELEGLAEDHPADPVPPALAEPTAAPAGPAATAGPAGGSISATEGKQLLGPVDDLLRQLDRDLAAFDDAATSMEE